MSQQKKKINKNPREVNLMRSLKFNIFLYKLDIFGKRG